MEFKDKLSKAEFFGAMLLLLLHCVFLPRILVYAELYFPIDLTDVQFNLLYYFISFVLVICVLGRYLKHSFYNLLDAPLRCLKYFVLSWILCFALNMAVNLLMMSLGLIDNNPNQNVITQLADSDRRSMLVLAVLLAPMVEEPLFRGGVFCTLRRKSRFAAYVVTVLLFGLYHVWSYALSARDIRILIYVLQYIPGGVALCMSYDKSGSIWTAILFHMSYNLVSMI